MTFGILAGAGLIFLFCVERFEVFPAIDDERVAAARRHGRVDHAAWSTVFFAAPDSHLRLYSACFVLAAGLTLGLAPERAVFGVAPEETPTRPPRERR